MSTTYTTSVLLTHQCREVLLIGLQNFKYLTDKPIIAFQQTPQFLHMLQAEEEGLIDIVINASDEQIASFADTLVRCCQNDAYGDISKEWNALREGICQDLTRRLLVPMGAKWLREHLRGQAEDFVAELCRRELEYVSPRKW